MLKSVSVKFTEAEENTELPMDGVTVLVGANNSGKSLFLREIDAALSTNAKVTDTKIIDDFQLRWPSEDEFQAELKSRSVPATGLAEGTLLLRPSGPEDEGNTQVNIQHLAQIIGRRSESEKYWAGSQFFRLGLARLDGRGRFNLTNDRAQGDLLAPPTNILTRLFVDDEARKQVREAVYDAFRLYFVIEAMAGGTLRIRLSQTEPGSLEQSLDQKAREYFSKAKHIRDASDGVQAYVGIIAAVVAGEFHTLLVDEPEAFLHPPLARKLGRWLSKFMAERNGSLVAATHSADFLMGCIQGAPNVRVARLEYQNEKSKIRIVDPDRLTEIYSNPLMRSSNVISSLFYDGVIVTESDNDRAFYSEIYHRLGEFDSTFPSVLFVNAQNKQTIKDIVTPLRDFGVPAAAIADIDIIKDGGSVWTDWMNAIGIPAAFHAGYAVNRDTLKKLFVNAHKDMKRDGGFSALTADDASAGTQFLEMLRIFGLFVVPGGELESWLPELGVTGKRDWVVKVLAKMGDDPRDAGYLRPSDGDVWTFVGLIKKWIENPARKGVR